MSRRGTLLIVIALLSAAPAARAAGRWTLGVNGGWTFPTGDYASTGANGLGATSGPQGGLEVGYVATERIIVGLDGAYVKHGQANEGDAVDVGGGFTLVNVKDQFPMPRVGAFAKFLVPLQNPSIRPYGLLGLGAYDPRHDYEYRLDDSLGVPTDTFTDELDNAEQPGWRAGGRIGLGALFQASETIDIDVRGDFHVISLNQNLYGISSIQYLGLQAGAVYRFR
jgi:hypothetical protein